MLGLFQKKKSGARNRRRFMRVAEKNAMLNVDGVSYAVSDWSLDGFLALGYRGGLERGDEARARLVIVYKGNPEGFDIRIRILRENEETRELAGQFLDMSALARRNLELVYADRVAKMERLERGARG
tara:strand:- start:454 stop:834 length:381 start_codon:yes stop_codon:yes gene_type:complete